MARIRLEPQDEYMHDLEEASNFNESMYFNVYDPSASVGAFFRLGNRANEGYAEMTTCIYLPDGRVAFMFKRPEISDNRAFDAGGMRFEVVTPFEALKVSYEGKAVVLDNPLDMVDPSQAFRNNPWVDCAATLDYRGVSPMFGGETVNDDGSPIHENAEEAFARGHYEQHVGATGSIRVGDEEFVIDGYGLRDHSWGPRHWQSPWWYRWLTANFGADFGFMLSIVASKDGGRRIGGMILDNGTYSLVQDVKIDTEWEGDDSYHQRVKAIARTADREYEVTGEVLSRIPLRNRRQTPEGEELVTRISEGMTRWTCEGREGYGLSEYLDQIIDGKPVGLRG